MATPINKRQNASSQFEREHLEKTYPGLFDATDFLDELLTENIKKADNLILDLERQRLGNHAIGFTCGSFLSVSTGAGPHVNNVSVVGSKKGMFIIAQMCIEGAPPAQVISAVCKDGSVAITYDADPGVNRVQLYMFHGTHKADLFTATL